MTHLNPTPRSEPAIMSLHLPSTRLRVVRPADPAVGLALAVRHLMSKSAFAKLRFGAWSQVLAGQVDRGHYGLATDDSGLVYGFLGWTRCTEATGEAWLAGRTFRDKDGVDKDCILFNACSADSPRVNRLLLRAARRAATGSRLAYFRRIYADGAAKLMRRPVHDLRGRDGGARRGRPSGSPLGRLGCLAPQ